MSDMPCLRTQRLSVGHQGVAIVSDLNLTVSPGEVVVLLGRNGAGKTTTLHTIAGLLPALTGDIYLGQEHAEGPLYKRARNGLGLVTEDRAIIRRLSVQDNLRVGGVELDKALAIFPELVPLRRRKAGLLSGGEQQMLALSRALAKEPRVLLADELSFGLAPLVVARLLEAVRAVAREHGTGVLLVEQHATAALRFADRGYVIADGRISIEGSATELRQRIGEIEESYLAAPGGADRPTDPPEVAQAATE
jgi:branched-chain amino acid transport system ATP-binding protein